jgi:glycosyltransferase involved in cell wall biosynthesis
MPKDLTVIIPFFNGHKTIDRLLASLPCNLPIIIVDDLSDDPLVNVGDSALTEVIRLENKGYFTGAVNRGIEACDTDVLILNQDIWFESFDWLGELELLRKKYDIVGDPVMGHPAWPKGYVQGTFMYISRECINKTGLMNEHDYPLWGSTSEYQLRACRQDFEAYPWQNINKWMRHEERKRSSFGSAITEVLRREPESKAQFIRTPPAISVVVPCYNYGKYLTDCINSLIGGPTSLGEMDGQTFQSFEIIIVDDCSSDDTPKIARELANPWQAIHYIRLSKNKGTAGAINAGIAKAKGRFITILSADDMRESWGLESLYRVIEKDNKLVPYDDMMIVKEGNRIQRQNLQNYNFDKLIYKNQVPAGIMFDKTAWQKVGGYPEEMKYGREDWGFAVALGVNGYCGVRIDGEPGYLYRRENQNRSKRNQGPAWYQRFLRQIQNRYPNIYKGERPMACCGGRDKGAKTAAKASNNVAKSGGTKQSIPGASGFILVEYVGSNAGDRKWRPPDTTVKYIFGGSRKLGNVAQEHLDWFVGLKENQKSIFRVAQPKPVVVPKVEIEVVNQPKPPSYDHLAEYYTYSLAKLKRLELQPDEWEHLLNNELNKINQRATVVRWLESQTEVKFA